MSMGRCCLIWNNMVVQNGTCAVDKNTLYVVRLPPSMRKAGKCHAMRNTVLAATALFSCCRMVSAEGGETGTWAANLEFKRDSEGGMRPPA